MKIMTEEKVNLKTFPMKIPSMSDSRDDLLIKLALTRTWKKDFEASHKFLVAMDDRVTEKQIEYGDNWKTVNVGFLRFRVTQNFEEWRSTSRNDTETECRKLVDLANLCRFLWERLNDQKKEILE